MSYISLITRSPRPSVLTASLLLVGIAACGSDSGSGAGGQGGVGGQPPPRGCIVPDFPGEPDIAVRVTAQNELVGFPAFTERSVLPGSTVTFTMHVDDETRLVSATLMDAWRLRNPPQGISDTFMQNTATGDETFTFDIPMTATGRYYADIELCGASCDELRVVYTLNRANAGPGSDAINDPYERIVYRDGAEVSSSFTCDDPNTIAIQRGGF